jgi:16S rRNA (cytosine967-C5)-methyltransferase
MSRPDAPTTSRALARAVLERVETEAAFANRALSAALDRARSLPPEERSLATELVYGVLRRQARLDRALEAIAVRGLGKIDLRVRIILRVAAYQILFLDRIPAYAAVNEAVDAVKQLRGGPRGGARGGSKARATDPSKLVGLTNALLRRLGERGEPPLPDPATDPLGHLVDAAGLPEWMARLALIELPAADAIAFADTIGAPAPLAVRVNTLRIDRAGLAARLVAERPGAEIVESAIAPHALLLRHMDSPFDTQAFGEGLFVVEDVGAQVVVELCGAAPGERILDACAGMGGKSVHLAALAGNQATIHAVDVAPAKLGQARELGRRLGVQGLDTFAADLTGAWPADRAARYHRVLLDAPCAGLGVLRRHPEALSRRAPEDLGVMAEQQARMLKVLAPLVLPGGSLTYSVCTFDRQECEAVVEDFLRSHPRFRVEAPQGGSIAWAALTDPAGFVRTWPQRHDADAFFAVRLRAGDDGDDGDAGGR